MARSGRLSKQKRAYSTHLSKVIIHRDSKINQKQIKKCP